MLLVRDMTEAQLFYEQVLGCSVDRALPEYGLLQLRAGRSLIDLVDIGSRAGEWARPETEGLTFRFGPRLRGFSSTRFRYSASRRCISSWDTASNCPTRASKALNSAECFIAIHYPSSMDTADCADK